MKFLARKIELRKGVLLIDVPRDELYQVNGLLQDIRAGKTMTVEIAKKRRKRSLDANDYLWGLITEIAAVLRSSKDEIYEQMIIRYGTVFTHVIVKPEAVEKFIREWPGPVRALGEARANGQKGIQLQCFAGSSTYDSKQFSRLLDGVIDEARALGIKTLDDLERQNIINDWSRKNG